jgi:hypothetical protein
VYKIKNKSQNWYVRPPPQAQSPTKKLQWSTALENDTMNENHFIHNATAGKTEKQ